MYEWQATILLQDHTSFYQAVSHRCVQQVLGGRSASSAGRNPKPAFASCTASRAVGAPTPSQHPVAMTLIVYPPIMENQMEKKMENEMETGVI